MSAFSNATAAVVSAIPPGETLTYSEVAALVGHPGAARAVGGVLARSHGLPWWRVVSSSGRLVPGMEEEQSSRLLAEGVAVLPRPGSQPLGRARA